MFEEAEQAVETGAEVSGSGNEEPERHDVPCDVELPGGTSTIPGNHVVVDRAGSLRAEVEASGLFDPDFYRAYHLDVAAADVDPLSHFMEFGLAEGRRPSVEFDGAAYLDAYPDVAAGGLGAFDHYLTYGQREGRALPSVPLTRASLVEADDLIRSSGLFDAEFYRTQAPVVRDLLVDPLLHYLLVGCRWYFEPSPNFSTQAYLVENTDAFGHVPLLHYLRRQGSEPGRPPSIAALRARKPFRPDQELMLERMATTSFFKRFGFDLKGGRRAGWVAECIAALAGRHPSLEVDAAHVEVSIIIPIYGQMPFVLSCLDSLAQQTSRHPVEIIVADDNSPAEERAELLAAIPWIRYLRRSENGGFLDNCNTAAASARGSTIVLLNSDTRVVHGWLDELVASFELFPNAGFVGSKLVNPDGTLQEAGGIYWSDGTAWNYGRDQDPQDPRYCFARQVDWVSGASIAVPACIWRELGGFDERYRPAYCEDVDLAFRIRERGYEVWYQPLSCVLHFEGMTHGRDEARGVKAHQATNLRRLRDRWAGKLKCTRPGGHEPDLEANRAAGKTMLVVDATTHTPDRDAGSVIASRLMDAYRALGFQLTFLPLDNCLFQTPYTEAYQRSGIQVLYSPFVTSLGDVLDRGGAFDYVFMLRYSVATLVLDRARDRLPLARFIFSNVDLHYLRMEREAAILGDRSKLIQASRVKTEELSVFVQADCSLVHTDVEKAIVLDELPSIAHKVTVLPWIAEVRRSTIPFEGRLDVMFLGGYAHPPNRDAATFFGHHVWPGIVDRLDHRAKFLVVGSSPTLEVQDLQSDRVEVTGHVPEIETYLDRSRVFVAPLRFGAGIKGKVIDAVRCGAPVVATSLAAEGIGLVSGVHFLEANTGPEIAEAVLRLYEDATLWARLQANAYALVEERFSWKQASALCERSLEIADESWLAREARARRARLQMLIEEDGAAAAPGRS